MSCEVKKQADERSMYFDMLRCISMFAVVGVHVYGSLLPSVGGVNPILSSIVEHFNSLGVFFFFAISGYFALKSECNDIVLYYKKRFVRIIIPYLVYAAIYTIYFTGIEQNDIFGIFWGRNSYVARIFTANVHGTHWYVYAILIFYLCVPYISRMFSGLTKKEIKTLYYGSFLALIICHFLSEFRIRWNIDNGLNTVHIIWMLKIFLMFTTGYVVNEVLHCKLDFIPKLFLAALAFTGYCWNLPFMEYILLFIVMQEGRDVEKKGLLIKCIKQLASQSYSIYLIHAAVLSVLLKFFANFNIPFWGEVIGSYILTVLVSDLISFVIDGMCTRRLEYWVKSFCGI